LPGGLSAPIHMHKVTDIVTLRKRKDANASQRVQTPDSSMFPGLTRTVAAGQSGDTWSPSRSDGPLNLEAVSEMAPLRGRDSSPDQHSSQRI
jgi:hypothetical protein